MSKKKPLCVVFNDVHIKTGNEEDVINSVRFMIGYCVDNGIKDLLCNGDIFDSRSFQRLSNLKCWNTCLDLFQGAGLVCHVNVGNHDKTRYDSEDSFLDPFEHHPAMVLYKSIVSLELFGKKVTMSPYFDDNILVSQLEESDGGDILFGHWEMAGSTNLGRVSEKVTINEKLLKKWKKTYLGHYHNYHEITKDIVHLPSLRQANFGEDDTKGFSVLFDDLSYEIVLGQFKRFTKIVINVDDTNSADIKELIKTHKNSKDTVRFEFIGEESKLKALNKGQFSDTGIDIKVKYSVKYDFDDPGIEAPEIIESYDKDKVIDAFKEFCKEKDYDVKSGMSLLEEFLNEKDGKEK